ncbi:MAG TPA: tryptophan--tRNA ligase, partial [Myxococcaceae bacterium]|nr:tryptophan--tRNA ligase [Myxococcaceae bacterium]
LDPDKAIFFRQSDVPEVCELTWIFSTVTNMGLLERAVSFKEKVDKGIEASVGLFTYPVLMAADILVYGSDLVPVGKDQVQHLEFARDWATKFNVTYVPGYDPADPTGTRTGRPGILKLPEALVQEATAVVPGTDGQKMSKSYNNTIDLFGDEAEVKKRIMGIKTDSTPVDAPKPLDTPLYQLLRVMLPESELATVEASWRQGGKGYGEYKKTLLAAYHATFGEARARYQALQKDPGSVDAILRAGAERARAVAAPFIERVRQAVGIER